MAVVIKINIMRKTIHENVIIKIKGKGHYFVARIPLWKAYLILADIEKHETEIKKLEEKRNKFKKLS